MENNEINKLLFYIGAALNLIALLDAPTEYYLFLRIFNSFLLISLSYSQYKKNQKYFFVSSFLLAILYNPIEHITMERGGWSLFNVLTSLYFSLLIFKLSRMEIPLRNKNLTEYQKKIMGLK